MALQSTVVPVRGIRLGYERFALAGLAALLLFLALAFVVFGNL